MEIVEMAEFRNFWKCRFLPLNDYLDPYFESNVTSKFLSEMMLDSLW